MAQTLVSIGRIQDALTSVKVAEGSSDVCNNAYNCWCPNNSGKVIWYEKQMIQNEHIAVISLIVLSSNLSFRSIAA